MLADAVLSIRLPLLEGRRVRRITDERTGS
jgi:hypothetical protein